MRRRSPPRALAALLVLAAPALAGADARPWYRPDHAKLQLAGEIGFVSPGVGWELAGRKVHLDAFAGWVPASVAGDDIWSATAKATWAPWRVRLGGRWRLQPVTAGLQATYTFGSQYFVTQPGRYPPGYYDLPTAVHTGVSLGGAAVRSLRGEREVGIYWEAVALGTMLRAWAQNPAVLSLDDVVSVALGTRLRF